MRRADLIVLTGLVAILAAVLLIFRPGPPAPTPSVFEPGLTLQEAQDRAARSGRPLVVVATADWCAPCQALKRGALSDPRVAALLAERAVPVYLEESVNPGAIRSLGVRVYPSTLVLDEDRVVVTIEGNVSPQAYLDTLGSALPPAE